MKQLATIVVAGIVGSIGLNFFLTTSNVLSAGMNGLSQIIVHVGATYFHVKLSMGLFIFLLNIPIFILSFIKLGKSATVLSLINVLSMSFFTIVIPEKIITDNILLNALVGGVLVGVGAGISLKMGFTTGGMDILSLIFSKITGKTVGSYMLALNGLIVLIAGLIFSWESALYTIISLYAMSRVVDTIHTSHQKLTAFIITTQTQKVGENISKHLFRGMTLLPSVGGYSGVTGNTIMMVITRYELYELEHAVLEVDENAFINIVPTLDVIGRFASAEQQRSFKVTGQYPEIVAKRKKR